jgi:signal transduction histidine kinase
MSPSPFRGVRARLLLAVGTAVAIAIVLVIVGFNLLLRQSLTQSAGNVARSRAAAALATLRYDGTRLTEVETPNDSAIDTRLWVFDMTGQTVEEPQAIPSDVTEAARQLALRGHGGAILAGEQVRLAANPIVRDGRRVGTIVAGVSLRPYDETARLALLASAALGVVLLATVLLIARWTLRRALDPVVEMTRAAEDWSEREPGRRFARGEPYDELTQLAATLDRLLDRLAAGLRHEQRFSAELSHELRTPLARIAAEAELALRRERTPPEYRAALAAVQSSATTMTRTVDALLSAARLEERGPRGASLVRDVAARSLEQAAALVEQRSLRVELDVPDSLRVGLDADHAERVIAPILENACRHARTSIRLSAVRSARGVVLRVEDDGPGVAVQDAERIFAPGERGADGGGAGLGLALARRLAEAADGEVRCEGGSGGAVFRIDLPGS